MPQATSAAAPDSSHKPKLSKASKASSSYADLPTIELKMLPLISHLCYLFVTMLPFDLQSPKQMPQATSAAAADASHKPSKSSKASKASSSSYADLPTSELKTLCKQRGLSMKGQRTQLLQRLQQHKA
jgi:hypothetical protein